MSRGMVRVEYKPGDQLNPDGKVVNTSAALQTMWDRSEKEWIRTLHILAHMWSHEERETESTTTLLWRDGQQKKLAGGEHLRS